ncbi:hypothetical protein TNIN_50161 [Trichonephila inaurata madagascariensis]|uniref:Uncharacterized protein n=1 Tax=Trichonephila inaurata madagascariensis TaxID=2747483 RepID=A0A8X6INU3_9ARAC|nr:hypothetical protein TNIN_50161 [Trichonephila inaurata madagascariensis]
MNNSLAMIEPEEKIELLAEIADIRSIEIYEDSEIDSTKDELISDVSAISIHEDTDAFSNGMDNTQDLLRNPLLSFNKTTFLV